MNKARIILPALLFLSLLCRDGFGATTGKAKFSLERDTAVTGVNSNMEQQFNPPGLSMEPFCLARDQVNGYLLAGDYLLPPDSSSESKTTGLIRIDDNGQVIWSKTMIAREEEVIQSIISTSDTGFLVSAFPFQPLYTNYSQSLLLFKLDKEGDIQWTHTYGSGASVSNYLSSLYETDDKGFVLGIGSFPNGGNPSYLFIVKTDPQGRVVWGHELGVDNNALYNIGGVIEKNGFIYATGSIYAAVAPFQLLRSFLTKMNTSSGQTIWTRQNDPGQPALSFTDLHSYKKGLLINSFTNDRMNDLIYTDNDGNTITSARVNNPYGSLNGKGNILVTADNSLYFHQYSGLSIGPYKYIGMRVDSNLQIAWQHDFYSQDSSFTGWNQIASAPLSGMAAIGSGMAANGLKTISFIKLDSTGAVCSSGNSGLSISTVGQSLIPMTWNTDAVIPIDITDLTQLLQPLTMQSLLFCPKPISGCDLLREHLPVDTVLCSGHSLVLDAGDGYSSYLWQDGSDRQTISVSTSGSYWVTVEGLGGCISTDTATIDAIAPLPSNFLPGDTVICAYASLPLQARQSYNSYLWNTGERTASIQVKTPGTYTLQVVDKYGCKGEDTIRVTTKNCPYGIYFPNAFTPGRSGDNDQFRPVVIGYPIVYHFSIYNRWGQRLFDTTDPKKGWDGKIAGQEQGSSGYVWVCIYQFGGEKENRQEGNFTLIR